MEHLRFDDNEMRTQDNRFYPVEEMISLFKETLSKYWTSAKELTIDEMISPFKGKCPFKVYQPLKPNKYGILVRAVCDARSPFLLNFEVYKGNDLVIKFEK